MTWLLKGFIKSKAKPESSISYAHEVVSLGSYALKKYGAANITLFQLDQAEALGHFADNTGLTANPTDSKVLCFVTTKKDTKETQY